MASPYSVMGTKALGALVVVAGQSTTKAVATFVAAVA